MRRLAVLGMLCVLVPAAVSGQDAAPTAAPLPSHRWSLGLRFQEAWNDNVRFQTADGEGDLEGRLAASVAHERNGARGHLKATAEGSALRYRDVSALDRFNYSGAVAGSYALSPRATFRGGEALTSTYAKEVPVLLTSGLLLPQTLVRTNDATAGLSLKLTGDTAVSVDVRHELVAFSNPALVDGSLVVASSALSRQLDPRNSLSLGYAYQRSMASNRRGDAHTVSGGWSGALGPVVSASALAGVTSFATSSGEERQFTPYAAVGLQARLQHETLDVRYTRSVSPAFGLGRDRVADLFSAGYARTLSRGLRLTASADYGLSRDPADPAFGFTTASLATDVSYALGRRFGLAGGYSYRRKGVDGPTAPVAEGIWGVSLNWGNEWQ